MSPPRFETESLVQKGVAAREAHRAVHLAFRQGLRSKDPEAYAELLSRFHAATAAAGASIDLAGLGKGERKAIDRAIHFLAADPFFFRSGYLKTALLRKLKQVPLTGTQRERLAMLVLERINNPDKGNRENFGRLAAALRLPMLDAELARLAQHGNAGEQHRAAAMMAQIRSARPFLPGAC